MEVWTILLTYLMLFYKNGITYATTTTNHFEKIGAILQTVNWKNVTIISDDIQNSILFTKSVFKYGIIVNTINCIGIKDIDPRSNVLFFDGNDINVLIDILGRHYSEKLLLIANR